MLCLGSVAKKCLCFLKTIALSMQEYQNYMLPYVGLFFFLHEYM